MKSLLEAFPAWTTEPYIHWSTHASLYSAKTRAYMIKKGINFTETNPFAGVAGAKDRWKKVIESAMGYFGIPVLDLPDGTFISDTTAIIRYLEEQHPEPAMQPEDPVMRALAWLIFNYGTEGLFLNAQHFRWSFKESADFAAALIQEEYPDKNLAWAQQMFRKIYDGTTDNWPDHIPVVLNELGLDTQAIEKKAQENEDNYLAVIDENLKMGHASGHGGVPNAVFRGEPFWGQDRIDRLVWRMKQNGLTERQLPPTN